MTTSGGTRIHPTAVVSPAARLGTDVTIGAFTLVHDDVVIGDRTVVGSHCVLGEPATAIDRLRSTADVTTCTVGPDSLIRSHSVLYQGAVVGDHFETGHHTTIREGSTIGRGVRIGTTSDVQGYLEIGDHTRLHSNVFVAQGTVIERLVWIFSGVVITDDPHPPSSTCSRGATIRELAVIAVQSTLLPGVEIGRSALVGAGSLVTRDVPAETVVIGSPARSAGSVRDVTCRHGALDQVYPWPSHFRRGYLPGALPDVDDLDQVIDETTRS